MSPRTRLFSSSRLAAAALVLAAFLAFSAAPALAGTGVSHPFLFSLNAGSGGAFDFPHGTSVSSLAVDDAAGKLYLGEDPFSYDGHPGADVVDVFDASSGAFLSELDGSNTPEHIFADYQTIEVAVDNSATPSQGTLYVSTCAPVTPPTHSTAASCPNDDHHSIIDVFGPSGSYLRQLDGSDTPAGLFGKDQADLAVDSAGNLYVAPAALPVIDKFDSSGNFLSEFPAPPLTPPYGPATAALGGGLDTSTGDAYFSNAPFITQRDSTGALLGDFGSAHLDVFRHALAVDSSTGRIYASNSTGGINTLLGADSSTVSAFGPTQTVTTPDVTALDPVSNVGYYTAHLSGAVNPQGVPTSYHFDYRPQGSGTWTALPDLAIGSGTSDVPVSADFTLANPLLDGTTYDVRLVATNTDADSTIFSADTQSFTTDTVPPPTIDQPSQITAHTAHVSGTVNPHGLPTHWHFSAGNLSGDAGSGTADVSVSGDLSGLDPNTTYNLTLTQSNSVRGGGGAATGGGEETSAPVSFKTLPQAPDATTISAGCLNPTSACLGGVVNPENSHTTYYFEWGADTSYGTKVPASGSLDAGSDLSLHKFTADLSALQPETTYHYRIVAQNQAGTTDGFDQTFITPSAQNSEPPRAIEQVNPPDSGNQNVAEDFLAPRPAAIPAEPSEAKSAMSPDGSRIAWYTFSGTPASTTGAFATFVSHRTPSGWVSQNMVPPASQQVGGGDLFYAPIAHTPTSPPSSSTPPSACSASPIPTPSSASPTPALSSRSPPCPIRAPSI